MSDETIEISFDNVSVAEANRYAQELEMALRSSAPGILTVRKKLDNSTQDIGTVVGVVITSSAAVALASGLADWIRLRKASITIKKNGAVVATGLTGEQSIRLAEIINARK